MLKVAQDSIKHAQDCARTYVDTTHRHINFTEADRVFLKVPERSETMRTRKYAKFCIEILWTVHSSQRELVLLPMKLALHRGFASPSRFSRKSFTKKQ